MLSEDDSSKNNVAREQEKEISSQGDAEEESRNVCGPSNQVNTILIGLSDLANLVIAQAANVVSISLERLQQDFQETLQNAAKKPVDIARSFLEYCCFKALAQLAEHEHFLHEAEFRHFSFDFMVAWEAPLSNKKAKKVQHEESQAKDDAEEEDASLFFSDLMPLLVEVENTVGVEAFVRVAPYVSVIADTISVYPQFETLTASTSGRLPFPVYDKYIEALEMSLHNMKGRNERSFLKALPLSDEEHVLEIDGTSQLVIQHNGSNALPGRLTLTDHCLYFEPLSLVSHKDAIKYDLSLKIDHTVCTELAGPWGSRIFDKAISYQTTSPEQHTVFEFPELVGSSRRDYWLAITQEVIDVHKVIRKYRLEDACKLEALARSALGIVRLQATRGCMQLQISSPGALLTFNLAQNILRGGDHVLEALVTTFKDARVEETNMDMKMSCLLQKSFSNALESCKVWKTEWLHQTVFYKVKHGEPTILEMAVKEARELSRYLQKAKEKEEQVKLDGIGTNVALLKELLQPITAIITWIRILLSWSKPLHTMVFFIAVSVLILRDCLGYIIPVFFGAAGALIVWLRMSGKEMDHRKVLLKTSSGGVSLDQVITAQRAVSQIEDVLQTLNVTLLKLLAIIMSVIPKVAVLLPVLLLAIALVLVLVPAKYVLFGLHMGLFAFTLRDRTTENKLVRRLRELWHSVPPVPVRIIESNSEEEHED